MYSTKILSKTSILVKRCFSNYIHYTKKQNIGVVEINSKYSKVNTLNKDMQTEFLQTLDKINNDDDIEGIAIISGKTNNFIVGADINMIDKCSTPEELTNLSKECNEVFKIIENGKPTVVGIHGNCLGGGLELALACDYRIGCFEPSNKYGFPEVLLGLLPGAGGTQRLPLTVGLDKSLPLLLTGKQIGSKEAFGINLIDKIVAQNSLYEETINSVQLLINDKLKKQFNMRKFLVNNIRPLRNFIVSKAKVSIYKTTKGNYPSPDLILESVRIGLNAEGNTGFETESVHFGNLGFTPESKNLRHLYHLQQKNKHITETENITHISVIGSGLMGTGIGKVSVIKNFKLNMLDINASFLEKAEDTIVKYIDNLTVRQKINTSSSEKYKKNIKKIVLNDINCANDIRDSDIIIEAINENIKTKNNLFVELSNNTNKNTILATNTSSLSIESIAKGKKFPERILGMHYFSPVEKMGLLEIIPHKSTSQAALDKAINLGLTQGKMPIVVKDVPGFYINRCLGSYLDEVMYIINEEFGYNNNILKFIDVSMNNFGFPVGPIKLIDEVGFDIANNVAENLAKDSSLNNRVNIENNILGKLINKGFLGKKNNKGFYKTNNNINSIIKDYLSEHIPNKNYCDRQTEMTQLEIQERLSLKYINEVIYCLENKIIKSPGDGDLGAVFGTGFPPFLGGPFKYVDNIGAGVIVAKLRHYEKLHGKRFTPSKLLLSHADNNTTFYK